MTDLNPDLAVAELRADIERQELAKQVVNGLDQAMADLDNLTDEERGEKWLRSRNGLCPAAFLTAGKAFVTCDLPLGHLGPHLIPSGVRPDASAPARGQS